MNQYIDEKWREVLDFNGLGSFEKIWALDAAWFEEPNHCRGGWSGVAKLKLRLPAGGHVGVFLKRQEDHTSRTFLHPIAGLPTFEREYENILLFDKYNVPSLKVVCFKSWKEEGHQRAILMTEELAGYQPLSSAIFEPGGVYASNRRQKKLIFQALAKLMQRMHRHGLMHNCLYPKHIFAKQNPKGELDLRLIDLEKAKKPLFGMGTVFRDLYSLNRHATHWSAKDKLLFFKTYCAEKKLSNQSKVLLKKIIRKTQKKKSS